MIMKLKCGTAIALGAVAALLVTAGSASAATESFTFTQSGFSENGISGVLNGSFSGTPEVNGGFAAADLTSFNAIFSETVGGVPQNFDFNVVNDFSYNPSVPGSFGFSAGSLAQNIIVCSGNTDVNNVCYNFTSPLSPRSSSQGFFEDLPGFPTSLTSQIAVVTQLGTQAGAATPEPATSALLAGAGLLLVIAGRWRRHCSRQITK